MATTRRRVAIAAALWLGVNDADERADIQQEQDDLANPCEVEWSGTITVDVTAEIHERNGPNSSGVTQTDDASEVQRSQFVVRAAGAADVTMEGSSHSRQVVTDPRAGNVSTVTTSSVCKGTDHVDPWELFKVNGSGDFEVNIPTLSPRCHSVWDGVCQGQCGPDNTPTHFEGDDDVPWQILGDIRGHADPKAASITGSKTFDMPTLLVMEKVTVRWSMTKVKKT